MPDHHAPRIVVIAPHEGRGTVHLDKLLPSLRSMGVRLLVAGWDRRGEHPVRFTSGGVKFRMIFRGWGYANRALALALPLWVVRAWWYLVRQRCDLIMALDFETGLPAALATLFTRVPFIYNIRDNFAMRPATPARLRPIIEALDKWVIRCAARVIVPDESRITESDERVRRKFVVVHNGALEVSRPEHLDPDRPFTVYAMGYLRDSRGIGLLLDAARHLPDIRVLLAGHIYEEPLREYIEATPNADYRGFLPVEQALQLCYESDVIFTFYSPDSEINRRAISNKWSDAMMACKPILINSEVLKSVWVEEHDIGYTCPYGDASQLAALIDHIRRHPEEAARKGLNGRRLYEAGYSWTAMETRVKRLIEDVVQESSH